jgi:ABC-type sugar transport system ATPase subunit
MSEKEEDRVEDAPPPWDGVAVRTEALVKHYPSRTGLVEAVRGVDLDVAAGELVAVFGRSGSGKSTLLHLLGGLDAADGGTIEVAGTRVDGAPERALVELRRRKVGFVFQSFHLLPELTGLENVLLPARLDGGGPALERGRELVSRLGLGDAAGLLVQRALLLGHDALRLVEGALALLEGDLERRVRPRPHRRSPARQATAASPLTSSLAIARRRASDSASSVGLSGAWRRKRWMCGCRRSARSICGFEPAT